MAVLCLCCCTWASSTCGKWGLTLQLWCTGFSLQWLLLLWTWAHKSAAKAGNGMMVVETSITLYQFKSNKRPQFRALSSPWTPSLPNKNNSCYSRDYVTSTASSTSILFRSFHCQLLNHFMKSASLSQFLLLQTQKRLRGWIICPIIQLIDERDIFIQDCFKKACSFDAEGLQAVFLLVWCFLWH